MDETELKPFTEFFHGMEEAEDNSGSNIEYYTERYKRLPAAIIREWPSYKFEKRKKLRRKMKRLRTTQKTVLRALQEMDDAFADLSDERDNMPEFHEELDKMMKRDLKQLESQQKNEQ